MYGKLILECELLVRTGLHIGGSSVFSAIGAVDSPVICDPLSVRQAHYPGQFVKGQAPHFIIPQYSSGYRTYAGFR